MQTQKIKIKSDYKLPDIIHDIEKGILRLPSFQRDFIWNRGKVIKLLDSIYNEYPIGSFFFWTAPKEYYFFYRDITGLGLPKPDKYSNLEFIIDGQQRITSLYAAVKGLKIEDKFDYSRICFDLDEKKFMDKRPDKERFISVKDLLANDRFEFYDELTKERKISLSECVERFSNYPFSAVDVRDKDLDEVCEIFERINQGGQRLNLFDLVSAGTWSEKFDLREKVKEQNTELINKGFGKIDSEIYTQTLALISRGSCTRASQLHLRDNDITSYWENTIESIKLSIDYLRNNFGVVNYDFIPYRGMISLVAYFFFKNKSRSLNNKEADFLSLWFWQSTFSERYSASTLTKITEDRKLFDKILEGKEVKVNFPISLNIESLIRIKMYQTSAIKNGFLCLLATKHPRHFKNNSLLSLADVYYSEFNSFEKHHIFPRSLIEKEFEKNKIHSLPNFCFLPAELNKEVSNKKPSKYFEYFEENNPDFKSTLKTQLIKYDESIKNDDYMSFLGSRSAMILEEIARVAGSKFSQVVSDDVNKTIDKTESLVRDLINKKIKLETKEDWKNKVPSDVVTEVYIRANDYVKKNPSKNLSEFTSRDLLDFCDVMDYPKIILTNWDVFYTDFRSKGETERRFVSLKEYRNAIKHNREIASFIKKEGEAAIDWLSLILERKAVKEKNGDGEVYNKEYFISRKFDKKIVDKFFNTVDEIENIAKDNGWDLQKKFNKGYTTFKIGSRGVFSVYWEGSKSFGISLKIQSDKVQEFKKMCPYEFTNNDKWAWIKYNDEIDIHKLEKTIELAYNLSSKK